MSLLDEFNRSRRIQWEPAIINTYGDTAMQARNPHAESDYADYLARRNAERELKNGNSTRKDS